MKKILCAIISLLLVLSVFGCVESGGNESTDMSVYNPENESSAVIDESDNGTEISETASEDTGHVESEDISEDISEEISEEVSEEISDEPSNEASDESSAPENSGGSSSGDVSGQAVFLESGFVLYNGAAYTQSYFSSKNAPKYAAAYEKYTELFPDTRINVIIAPLASITILDKSVSSRMSDQGKLLDRMQAAITGDVNFVNLKNVYVEHADEYLFYRSDHHWTHRGAYYAYSEFAKSVGITPTPIESFELKILKENVIGSMYNYTGDSRVKYYYDTVEAYMPTKACTMTIYNSTGNTVRAEYDTCILTNYKSYSSFIGGDHPYTVINVPENDQDKSILVIKDSYGNAFVPYLTEHYGNIIVIDPRYSDLNVVDKLGDYGLDDIVFLVNSSMGNTSAWCRYYNELIS